MAVEPASTIWSKIQTCSKLRKIELAQIIFQFSDRLRLLSTLRDSNLDVVYRQGCEQPLRVKGYTCNGLGPLHSPDPSAGGKRETHASRAPAGDYSTVA